MLGSEYLPRVHEYNLKRAQGTRQQAANSLQYSVNVFTPQTVSSKKKSLRILRPFGVTATLLLTFPNYGNIKKYLWS